MPDRSPQLLALADPLKSVLLLTDRERKALLAAGLETVGDILRRIPRRYEDRRHTPELSEVLSGETCCLRLHVYSAGWRFSYKRYFEVSAGPETDPHGPRLLLRWFNMPYVAKMLATGMNISVYGKVKEYAGKLTMGNPEFEVLEDEESGHRLAAAALGDVAVPALPSAENQIHTARIVPIYRAVSGLAARSLRDIIYRLLKALPEQVSAPGYDVAPAYPYRQALEDIHFPQEEALWKKARLRFALSECFACQFQVAWRRHCTEAEPGMVTATTDAYMQEMLTALPFRLTAAQRRCVEEIRQDMASTRRMNRLLQGDVGSGKTLVALCAMLLALESGKTAALIAPTQILAEQHYNNFRRLLSHTDVRISLRTGDRSDDTDYVLEDGNSQDLTPRLIVGTHALLYKKNRPPALGLAVIDEQHKFGVAQRDRFINGSGTTPDVLVMTATPIPRTLTLTLYGDLDVSIIDELPANRGEIITARRTPAQLPKIISFLRDEMNAGRQIYIIAPLIEESESRQQASALSEFEKWKKEFPEVRIGLLHGRLSPEEKDAVMADFRDNVTPILVATTVVEVGVDVPNATVMLINDADAFGLSQLHQLRGRIGRGQHKSYCILLSSAKKGEPGSDKLDVLCRTLNGFEIAEEDFRLRGPGDVLGTAQSGLRSVQFIEWLTDSRLIHRANRDAQAILAADPQLLAPEHAPLRELIAGEYTGAVVS